MNCGALLWVEIGKPYYNVSRILFYLFIYSFILFYFCERGGVRFER
jgi:hypothetical protein